jgi:hypothetical protein
MLSNLHKLAYKKTFIFSKGKKFHFKWFFILQYHQCSEDHLQQYQFLKKLDVHNKYKI